MRHHPTLLLQPLWCIIFIKQVVSESREEASDTFLPQGIAPGALCSWISAPCRWPAGGRAVTPCLYTLVHVHDIPAALQEKKGLESGRYGEKYDGREGGLLLLILLLPQFVFHIVLQTFSSKLWEQFPVTGRL